MKFSRQQPPVKYKDYKKYRQYTQQDFQCICAHCFRHEEEAGGEEHFEQDHFEPKHRQNVDPADYFNLYWSCRGCNGPRNKGKKWPTEDQLARGESFCDACDHDPVGTDYLEKDDTTLQPLTPSGAFTIRHIRLNERSSLLHLRLTRRRVQALYLERLRRLQMALHKWQAQLKERPSSQASEKCAKLSAFADVYESFVTRDPFMMLFPYPPEVPPGLLADF